MARRSLRPQLNQIRTWVRQGRTDAWIAHQLEVTAQQIAAFKRENKLAADGVDADGAGNDFDDEIDLRAEDDALIAAELEAAQAAKAKADAEAEEARKKAEAAKKTRSRRKPAADDGDADDEAETEDDDEKPARRRSRRGGRSRRKAPVGPLEGTFDHGDEGYGLWLDPAVQDDPIYAEHWAGHRPVEITIEEDQIVIKRLGDD
jgi:hypothetical protein